MSKEKIAEKLGWEPEVRGWRVKDGVCKGTDLRYLELPDWENSLDAQARDIWPFLHNELGLTNITLLYTYYDTVPLCKMKAVCYPLQLHKGETLAQACWKAICEVML